MDHLELISGTIWICKGMNHINPNRVLFLTAMKTHLTADRCHNGLVLIPLIALSLGACSQQTQAKRRKLRKWGNLCNITVHGNLQEDLTAPGKTSPSSNCTNLKMRDTAKCIRGGGIKSSFEDEKAVHEGNNENPLLGTIMLRFVLFYAEGAQSSLLSDIFKCMTAFNRSQQRLKKEKKELNPPITEFKLN